MAVFLDKTDGFFQSGSLSSPGRFNLITPLGDIFVLDSRDFFVAIGAVLGGLIGGFIIGFTAGVPAKIAAIDIAAFSVAGLTMGFFSTYFYRKGIDVAYAAVFQLTGYCVAPAMVYYYQLLPFARPLCPGIYLYPHQCLHPALPPAGLPETPGHCPLY